MGFVYDFADGSKEQRDLLGGKGANLAEMTNLGLPVPPGFTISTETCRAYLAEGGEPDGLAEEVTEHLAALEEAMGKKLGDADDPLLVSVRSGAKFSMPGMMETVLNVGLNDESVRGLAAQSGSERFAWDSYRRLTEGHSSRLRPGHRPERARGGEDGVLPLRGGRSGTSPGLARPRPVGHHRCLVPSGRMRRLVPRTARDRARRGGGRGSPGRRPGRH